jgi:hypothetical protein
VVERALGKGEVECSIHSGGTTFFRINPLIFKPRRLTLAAAIRHQSAGKSRNRREETGKIPGLCSGIVQFMAGSPTRSKNRF